MMKAQVSIWIDLPFISNKTLYYSVASLIIQGDQK